MIFISIVFEVMFPIFILICIGASLHRFYQLHLRTLSKLLSVVFLPVVIFTNISTLSVDGDIFLHIGLFLLIQFLILSSVAAMFTRSLYMNARKSSVFKNSTVLMNSGNFGLPVSQLVFATNPLGVSVQIIVLVFQNFLTFTYGIFNAATTEKIEWKQSVKPLLQTPVIYALILGFLFYVFHLSLPETLDQVFQQLASGFTALALLVLGAQTAYPRLKYFSKVFFLMIFLRLIGGPLVAFLIIYFLQLEGTIAQALLISSAFPISRNSALFALEYDNEPEMAAQGVLFSTIVACVTVPMIITVAQTIFSG